MRGTLYRARRLTALLINDIHQGRTAMGKIKHFFWFQFPALAWAIAIFVQSSIAYLSAPDLGFNLQDKFLHAIEYAIFGFLLWRALSNHASEFLQKNSYWLTFLLCSLYAISDEFHQSFVPGRTADVDDVIADFIGAGLIVTVFYIRRKVKQRNRQRSLVSTDRSI